MIVRARTDINERLICKILKEGKGDTTPQPPSTYFFNSGKSSIQFLLRIIGGGKTVGIQVYTCQSVLDAILAEDDKPLFLDINPDYYTTTLDIVEKIVDKVDILILTHLFGIPNPDYIAIKNLCETKGIVLIDDLCQTFHAKVLGRNLEDMSDNYVYSFFYDKPISSLSGGMLKISNVFKDKADVIYSTLPKMSEGVAKKKLKSLLLMHKLLSPEIYTKEFRDGDAWKWILFLWPISWSILLLNYLVKGIWMRFLNKIVHFRYEENYISAMSELEIGYLLKMMFSFSDNNQTLYKFCVSNNIEIPGYLKNERISCSIAKRAIVKANLHSNHVQIGLYNWPTLICPKDEVIKFPRALSVINSHVNIPCWTDIICTEEMDKLG